MIWLQNKVFDYLLLLGVESQWAPIPVRCAVSLGPSSCCHCKIRHYSHLKWRKIVEDYGLSYGIKLCWFFWMVIYSKYFLTVTKAYSFTRRLFTLAGIAVHWWFDCWTPKESRYSCKQSSWWAATGRTGSEFYSSNHFADIQCARVHWSWPRF